MAGMAEWKAKISLDLDELRKQLKNAEDRLDKFGESDHKIKLNIDETVLDSAIKRLDKMLESLGKGTGDFKQFETLSKEISDMVSSVKDLSSAFGKLDGSGAQTLLSSIQNIDKSISSLNEHLQKTKIDFSKISNEDQFSNDKKSAENLINLFEKVESHLSSIKKVFSDVGDGEEFSPLLQTIKNVESAIDSLSQATKGIGFNMNIDVGSNKELEQQLESKVSNALSAYERLFEHIKMSNAGDSYMMNNFFDFDINQFDTMMAKVQAYRTFIENQRKDYEARTGHSGAYDKTDKKYWTQASSAMGQITKIQNEIKASNDGSSLENLFGKTDLTEVISGLNQIVVKLDEIVNSAKDLKTAFADGLKIESATADVTELTNKVKALEEELQKLKTATSSNPTSPSSPNTPNKPNTKPAYNKPIVVPVDFTPNMEGFDEIVSKFKYLEQYKDQIEKITKVSKQNQATGKYDVSYNARLKDGSTYDLGESSTPQMLAAREVAYNAKEIERAEKQKQTVQSNYLKQKEQEEKDYQKQRAQYIAEGKQQEKEYTDWLIGENLYQNQTYYDTKAAEEKEYQRLKAQYIAEGKQQEKEQLAEREKYIKEQNSDWSAAYKDKNRSDKANATAEVEKQARVYKNLTNAISDYSKISKLISRGEALDTDITKAEELENQISVLQKNPILSEQQVKESERLLENLFDDLDRIEKKIDSTQKKSSESSLLKQISSYESDVSRWDKIVHDRETKPETGSQSSTYQNNLTEMKAAYKEMHDLQVKMSEVAKQGIGPSQADVDRFGDLKTKLEGCEQSFKDLTAAQKGSTSLSRDKLFNKIGDYLHKNSGMAKEFKVQLEALQKELTLRGADANVSDLTDKFLKLQIAIREAGQEGRIFLDVVKDKAWYGLAGQIATYFSFQDIVRYIGNAVKAVVELDDALIDLKKTTTMTGSQLNQFYFDANDVAKQMGVTTKEIIDQASAWSRLGYSSKEASTEMAQLSSQFASISPGMATDDAQNGLVSIMKAWRIDPDQVKSEIMDPINQLGNTMAENNQDIIEGMERSAAALAAVGTSARDSYAIFSAMQEVLQNSEKAGTSLRSVALRLRSFDETTGEVSDDLQNITGELIDLTKTAEHAQGVSIFKPGSTTEFKSLVDYFGEIHDIWDEMSQKQQNDFLLKAFGRTQAQAGAALIQNYSAVTKALEEMDKAAGSSDREMSTVEQSLTYKLNALKETWVGTAQAIGDREGIGNAISGLTSLSEVIQSLVKNFGLVKPLAAGLGAVLSTQNVGRGKMYPLMFEYADNNMCSLGY